MREKPPPWRSHRVYRTCRAERCRKSFSCVPRPLLRKRAGHSVRACRSLGLPRLRECGDPLSRLSTSAQTNARRLWWRYKHYLTRTFAGDNGRIQDDRGAIRQQRKRLPHREKQAFHIAVKECVVMLLSNLAQ